MSNGHSLLKAFSTISLLLFGGVSLSAAQAASFDCAKASTKVEKLICADAELSKLDEELAAAYKAALQDEKRADAIGQTQKQWMKERNGCADAGCVQSAYLTRIEKLKTGSAAAEKGQSAAPGAFKGEYILVRGEPGESFCKRFKDNFNRFRKLDFDQCHPRLSDKFPEFSRPYEWNEIPFDMALAEKAVRSTVGLVGNNDPEGDRKRKEAQWQQWLKGSESFRAAGTARMWLTKIDLDVDGQEETLLRMVPGGRYPIDQKRPSLWSCDYNIGELYVLDSASGNVAEHFNLYAGWSSDIIHDAESNRNYLLSWELGPSSALGGWGNQEVFGVGGTRGVSILNLYRPNFAGEYGDLALGKQCLIDWVPTGHYIPAPQPKHKRAPATH
jgi:uncharacterized protein YecT (DUF1311 family)